MAPRPRRSRPTGSPDEQRPAWWVPRVLGAAAATVLVIAGTTWAAGPRVSSSGDDGAVGMPEEGTGRAGAAAYDEPRDVAVTTYAVGASGLLLADRHLVEDATGDPLEVAVAQLVTGQVVDDDLSTAWPVEEVEVATRVGSDRVTVDLAGLDTGDTGGDVGGAEAVTAVQALVWTVATATRSRLPVEVLADGAPVERLWGLDLADPVRPDTAALSPVQVESPSDGAVVSSAFTVRGWATTEDGLLTWQLLDGEEVVRVGTARAEDAGAVSPYRVDVSAPVGDFTLVVSVAGARETKRLRVR